MQATQQRSAMFPTVPTTTHCEVCGRAIAGAPDPWTQFTEEVAKPVADGLRRLLAGESPWPPWTPPPSAMPSLGSLMGMAPHPAGKHHRCNDCDDCEPCRSCGPDPCHCRCCVDDADLAVHLRLGERRVVPVLLSNHWRRERDVSLELSDFTSRGGKKPVDVLAQILPETAFKLGPCEERQVFLLIETTAPAPDQAGPEGVVAHIPDVDDCTVLFADLRVVGCDTRASRIALALLPRDCGPFHVKCQCSCC